MKNIWSAIFTRAVVDSTTNSLSLFDCVEEVTVNFSNLEDISREQKNIPISFTIVSMWSDKEIGGKREFNCLVEIIDPQGKKLHEFPSKPVFEKGKKRLRTIMQIDGLTVTSEGEYTVIVKYKLDIEKFSIASKIPLDIKFILSSPVVRSNQK